MLGNGNQPSLSPSGCLSGVRPVVWPSFQWPISSIAAWPLASMPAELPAPSCAGVARKPSWKGVAASSCWTSWPALTKHGSVMARSVVTASSAAWGHSRVAKLAHQNASGHLSLPPSATGTIPAALSLSTAA